MAEPIITKSGIDVTLVSGGYGTKMKAVVNALLSMEDDLYIAAVNSDTDDLYSVDIAMAGFSDVGIRLANNNAVINITGLVKAQDGTFSDTNQSTAGQGVNYFLFLELVRSGNDVFVVSINDGGSTTGGTEAGKTFTFINIVDQFSGETKSAVNVYSSSYAYFSNYTTFYVSSFGASLQCLNDKNANGLTPNGYTAAIPVVFYTESVTTPLSGFVGKTNLLYIVYNGSEKVSFNTRYTRFMLGDHNFISLGQYICLRID